MIGGGGGGGGNRMGGGTHNSIMNKNHHRFVGILVALSIFSMAVLIRPALQMPKSTETVADQPLIRPRMRTLLGDHHHHLQYHQSPLDSGKEGDETVTEAVASTSPASNNNNNMDIKLLAFTDYGYRQLALKWYQRMMKLGYRPNEVTLVTTDTATYDFFRPFQPPQNDDSSSTVVQFASARQGPALSSSAALFSLRWRYVLQLVKAGTSVILADVDNIFVRHVPLHDIFRRGGLYFDVIHAYGTKHPRAVFLQQGFVLCGCLTALRASEATVRYVEQVVAACGSACDDQQVFNTVYWTKLQVEWDNNNYSSATPEPRTSSKEEWFNDLPIQGRTGRSRVTNHTVAVWDRDFATRGGFLGEEPCPSSRNWVSMPNHNEIKAQAGRLETKLAQFEKWDAWCGTSPFENAKHVNME
jgi:hypothetical protein